MGGYGCVGAQGARGTQKQGKKVTFRSYQALIWALWPGKFSGHHVFAGMANMGLYGCGRVHMGVGGCIGEQGHGRNKK